LFYTSFESFQNNKNGSISNSMHAVRSKVTNEVKKLLICFHLMQFHENLVLSDSRAVEPA